MTIVENLIGKVKRLRLTSTGKDFHSSMFSKCPAEGELSFFPKQWLNSAMPNVNQGQVPATLLHPYHTLYFVNKR